MNNASNIKHVWFDFTDTIAAMDKVQFDKLIYTAYAEVVQKEATPELIEEYKKLLKQHKSNSAVFVSLGMSSDFLSGKANANKDLYHLTDNKIPDVVEKLTERVPVSIFSNTRLDTLLPALGIKLEWITHLLGPDVVKKPKPALDGFNKMVALSGVSPHEILYVGDDVEKDLLPAQEIGLLTGLLWKDSDVPDYCFKDFSDIASLFG